MKDMSVEKWECKKYARKYKDRCALESEREFKRVNEKIWFHSSEYLPLLMRAFIFSFIHLIIISVEGSIEIGSWCRTFESTPYDRYQTQGMLTRAYGSPTSNALAKPINHSFSSLFIEINQNEGSVSCAIMVPGSYPRSHQNRWVHLNTMSPKRGR